MIKLSFSSISLYLECRRKYYNQKVLNVFPKKSATYFVFGEALHKFLERHYTKIPNPELAIDEVFKNVQLGLLDKDQVHDLEVQRSMAHGIAAAYPAHYEADLHNYKTFLPERKFELNLRDFSYTGEIDMLIQDQAGDWWIFETKTASGQGLTSDYIDRVKVDWQVTGYLVAAKSIIGVRPRGVVYNIIKKPGIRLKKGETKQAFQRRVYEEYTKHAKAKNYFSRHEYLLSEDQVSDWKRQVIEIGQEIVARHQAANKRPWLQSTNACIGKYGTCIYLPACIDRKFNPMIYETQQKA